MLKTCKFTFTSLKIWYRCHLVINEELNCYLFVIKLTRESIILIND